MDPVLNAIASAQGVFLTREAHALGYDDNAIAAAVRAKLWHRVRRGAFVPMTSWLEHDAYGRHRILIRAVMRSLQGKVAVSHVSNLVERGIKVWGVDLSRVHVTRLDGGAGRIERDVQHHEGLCLADDVETVNGLLMVKAARAVLESLCTCGVEAGLVLADSALHLEAVSAEELAGRYDVMEFWPGMRSAQIVLRLADGRAESPGESRVRYICWEQGLPAPELQFHVCDEHGVLIGITDFAWPKHRLLGEFDGRIKYGRLLKPGQTPSDVVFDEKRREDLLREATGYGMVRPIWTDLSDHAVLARRIRRLMRPAAA